MVNIPETSELLFGALGIMRLNLENQSKSEDMRQIKYRNEA